MSHPMDTPGRTPQPPHGANAETEPETGTDVPDSAEAGLTIRLAAFEGPLDLLLHLIKREELDIWNIPIARVTEQYLAYLAIMKELNINVAGEWLVTAATLIYIKSRMLLPPDPVKTPAEEAQEDPRAELVYQLLEHQKFRNAAQMLHTREEIENAIWHKPPQELIDGEEVVDVTLFDLVKAFREILERFEERLEMDVAQDDVSVEQAIAEFRQLLLAHDTLTFSSFFESACSRRHLIALFLALLELVRLHEISVMQKKTFDEIRIKRISPEAE
jgi:segregation and condensation protein A